MSEETVYMNNTQALCAAMHALSLAFMAIENDDRQEAIEDFNTVRSILQSIETQWK